MEMTDDLYLIAHKVRGELAFDVAIKLQIGEEEGWIIPTSGHRAYPYWDCHLVTLLEEGHRWPDEMPPDLPDHYPINHSSSPRPSEKLKSLNLADLGL
jgi:hypothetical protein